MDRVFRLAALSAKLEYLQKYVSILLILYIKLKRIVYSMTRAKTYYTKIRTLKYICFSNIFLHLFRGVITPLSSSYNSPGLAPGVLVTFSMLLTETSEISKSLLFGSCPGINV